MNDRLYYYSKVDGHRALLGQIQSDFNMSFVIDGTKDSAKVICWSYDKETAVEPYTIVRHENTNTWWIVSHDKVERYENESGYLYIHNLQLEGAIELLNARDLTDCGFNDKTYTIGEFLQRLFKLSIWKPYNDFSGSINIDYGGDTNDNLNPNILVDYIKTFENYTPLSAIREFLDGYNCVAKLSFREIRVGTGVYSKYVIVQPKLTIIPKTGNLTNASRDISHFNEVKATRTIDKNSYGTSVISNAENVISTRSKTYPTTGGVKVSGTQYNITPTTALIRLPSNAFKINRIDMMCSLGIRVFYTSSQYGGGEHFIFNLIPEDETNVKAKLQEAISWLRTFDNQVEFGGAFANRINDFENQVNNNFYAIQSQIINQAKVSMYNDVSYDPINDTFSSPHGLTNFKKYISGQGMLYKPYVLVDAETRSCLLHPYQGIYCERGSNEIKGFDFFDSNNWGLNGVITSDKALLTLFSAETPDSHTVDYGLYLQIGTITGSGGAYDPYQLSPTASFKLNSTRFVINYIPMSDLKIKYDNYGDTQDNNLYNQNGRLNDSNSLSKLLLSHSKEITTENITRFRNYTNFSDIPNVGDRFEETISGTTTMYVINSVSLDFSQNEGGYYINGEFTLSLDVAVKSLLTSPNTNIRDYGIPQNNNVVRKQLYRDFYELGYTSDLDSDLMWYLPLSKVVNVGYEPQEYQEHIAVIKTVFDNGDAWYYQLDTTTYMLKKSVYEVVNFNDNNIIGYSSQTSTTGFDIRRIFNNSVDNINTPISYVDDNGKVKDIYVAFCSNQQLTAIYKEYQEYEEEETGMSYDGILYNYSVFIDSLIYESNGDVIGAKENTRHDFLLEEVNYNKDALEVPFFEYSCQVDDSKDIIIGENILDNKNSDICYVYRILYKPIGYGTNNNISIDYTDLGYNSSTHEYYFNNYCIKFEYVNDNEIKLSMYNSFRYNVDTKVATYGTHYRLDNQASDNIEFAIVRYTVNQDTIVGTYGIEYTKTDLFMTLKDLMKAADNNCFDSNGDMIIKINHYKIQ